MGSGGGGGGGPLGGRMPLVASPVLEFPLGAVIPGGYLLLLTVWHCGGGAGVGSGGGEGCRCTAGVVALAAAFFAAAATRRAF